MFDSVCITSRLAKKSFNIIFISLLKFSLKKKRKNLENIQQKRKWFNYWESLIQVEKFIKEIKINISEMQFLSCT